MTLPMEARVQLATRDNRFRAALVANPDDPDWRARALCRAFDPDKFFPIQIPGDESAEAVRICRGCDVQSPCLAAALSAGEAHGIWGSTTPKERQPMLVAWYRKNRRRR